MILLLYRLSPHNVHTRVIPFVVLLSVVNTCEEIVYIYVYTCMLINVFIHEQTFKILYRVRRPARVNGCDGGEQLESRAGGNST